MAGKNGGARPGAGRKSKDEKFRVPVARAEKQIVDRLPQVIENLIQLANGGYERVSESWEPAGLVMRKTPRLNSEGEPMFDEKGKPIMLEVPAFPDLDPAELVLVERRREIADRDRAANIYLVDRIMGKPLQKQELTNPDGSLGGVMIFIPDNGRSDGAGPGATGDTTAAGTADDVSEQPV